MWTNVYYICERWNYYICEQSFTTLVDFYYICERSLIYTFVNITTFRRVTTFVGATGPSPWVPIGATVIIWTILHPLPIRMISNKFGWNLITRSGDENENVKKFTHDGRRTNIDDNISLHLLLLFILKLTWNWSGLVL